MHKLFLNTSVWRRKADFHFITLSLPLTLTAFKKIYTLRRWFSLPRSGLLSNHCLKSSSSLKARKWNLQIPSPSRHHSRPLDTLLSSGRIQELFACGSFCSSIAFWGSTVASCEDIFSHLQPGLRDRIWDCHLPVDYVWAIGKQSWSTFIPHTAALCAVLGTATSSRNLAVVALTMH